MGRQSRRSKGTDMFLGSFSRNTYSNKSKPPKVDIQSLIWQEAIQPDCNFMAREINELRDIITEWHEKRNVKYGVTSLLEGHSCGMDCVKSGNIEVISWPHNLYGCIDSGVHHRCKSNGECKNTITNSESVNICLYSNQMIDVVMESRPYGDPVKNRHESGSGKRKHDDIDYDDDEPAFVPTLNSRHKTNKKLGHRSSEDVEFELFCKEFCDDGDSVEPHSIQKIAVPLDPPVINPSVSPVEGQEANTIPIPDVEGVTITEEEQSATQAPFYGSKYIVGSTPVKKSKKRKCFSNNNHPSLVIAAKTIIEDLIFNSTTRNQINARIERELNADGLNNARKYVKHCRRAKIRPLQKTIDDIFDHCINKKCLMRIIPMDRAAQTRYAEVCCRLWTEMMKTPYFKDNSSGFHFKEHVMGTLYIMQAGLQDSTKTADILPQDKFLYEGLPSQSDLKDIKPSLRAHKEYKKSDITQGRNIIKYSINSAELPFCENLSKIIQTAFAK